jgi:hypothetical protein
MHAARAAHMLVPFHWPKCQIFEICMFVSYHGMYVCVRVCVLSVYTRARAHTHTVTHIAPGTLLHGAVAEMLVLKYAAPRSHVYI